MIFQPRGESLHPCAQQSSEGGRVRMSERGEEGVWWRPVGNPALPAA